MDIYVFDKAVDSLQLAFRCDFLEQCINLLAYLHSRHLPFSISLLSMLSFFYFVCIALQSLLYKNVCSISIFFSNKLFSILILRIKRSKISKSWKSSPIVDTYLYGLSYRSCIRTCSPLAIFSNVSSLGTLPLHNFPSVDLGTPVKIDTCRSDSFF